MTDLVSALERYAAGMSGPVSEDCGRAANEIRRLRAALEELRVLGAQGSPPDYTRWLAFHDRVREIAEAALTNQQLTPTGGSDAKDKDD